MSPLVLAIIALLGLVIVFGSRQKALIAFMVGGILIPMDQVLVIGGLHFTMIRVLILFGAVRIIKQKLGGNEVLFSGGPNWLDVWFLILSFFTALDYSLLWQNSAALIFSIGNLYSAIGIYLIWRFLIRDESDVRQILRTLAFVVTAVAVIMVTEHILGRNLYYSFLGGGRASDFGSHLVIRDGQLRATGVFAHPILAGSFGGFCFPLFVGLWWRGIKSDRRWAALGMVSALVPPIAANSSTALFGFIGGFVALCFWPFRRRMRLLRWSITIALVTLHLAMKAPVWHLISRVDLSGGSSSYHRYQLVNQCIIHFWDWALLGTKDYGSWGWDMWDLSNQYVGTADTVGLIPLVSFLAIIVLGFRYLGNARKALETAGDRKQELFIWAFAASLFANVVAFFGIGYFDQTVVAWYAILSMICTMTAFARSAQPEAEATPAMIKSEPGFRTHLGRDQSRVIGPSKA